MILVLDGGSDPLASDDAVFALRRSHPAYVREVVLQRSESHLLVASIVRAWDQTTRQDLFGDAVARGTLAGGTEGDDTGEEVRDGVV